MPPDQKGWYGARLLSTWDLIISIFSVKNRKNSLQRSGNASEHVTVGGVDFLMIQLNCAFNSIVIIVPFNSSPYIGNKTCFLKCVWNEGGARQAT